MNRMTLSIIGWLALWLPAQALQLPGDAVIGLAASNQDAPSVALGGGTLLAVWADTRPNPYGSYDYETARDIYGARLSADGTLLDAVPFLVTGAPATQERPRVAWNGQHFLVVFESYDLSGTGFYYDKGLQAVRVSAAGEVLDEKPIRLFGLSTVGSVWGVASDGVNWVVVNQGSSNSMDIVAVRVSPAGVVLDPPTRTLVEATYYMRSNLHIAYAGGVFLLTFDDVYSNGLYTTSAVRFDSNLNVLGGGLSAFLGGPVSDLAANGTGFYVVWNQQLANFSMAITGSRVDSAGNMLDGAGDNISSANPADPYVPIGVVWDGTNWRATWGSGGTLRTARVSSSGQVLDPGGVAVAGPSAGPAAGNGQGGVLVTWSPYQNGQTDVLASLVSASNSASPDIGLSNAAPSQSRAAVAASGSGYMVAYHSRMALGQRVLAQPLDAAGTPLTAQPVELASGDASSGPGNPGVAWNGSVYLVSWASNSGVFAQRLLPDGTKLDGAPFQVLASALGPPGVGALGGDFLVVGRRYGYTPQIIFPVAARVRGVDGAVLDPSPLALYGSYARAPTVTALGGRWLVAYHNNATHDDSYASTLGTFVDAAGTASSAFGLHGPFSTAGGNFIFELGLASDGNRALLVQSEELTSGVENDLLGRFVEADGTVSSMFNLTPWEGNQYRPRAAWDGSQFVLVYQDQRNRKTAHSLEQLDARSDLYGMRIGADGTVRDPQGFVLSASPLGETDPNVAGGGGISLLLGSRMDNAGLAAYRVFYGLFGSGPNQWPVALAQAVPDAGEVPLTVAFSSAGSLDPDGVIVSYAWDFGDGSGSALPSPTHEYVGPGPFVATLTLTDDAGARTVQALLVDAVAPNQLPVAVGSALPASGPAPLDVVLYADGSYDPDGFLGNILWEFSDGGSSWGSPAYHTFSTEGGHAVSLTVYDSTGATSSTLVPIEVGGTNQSPVARAGASPGSGTAPLLVSFSSAGSQDPDGSIASYQWTFGDGGSSTAANPSHSYVTAGTYTAQLRVTDNRGATDTDTAQVTVSPLAANVLVSSAVNLSASVRRGAVRVAATVTVRDGNGATVRSASVRAQWTLANGTRQSAVATTNRSGQAKFSASGGSGTYTLQVTDITKAGYVFDTAHSVLTGTVTR